MSFLVISPSGKQLPGYTKRDALYAAGVLAEKENRKHGKHEPVAVYDECHRQIAAVWLNAMEEWTR